MKKLRFLLFSIVVLLVVSCSKFLGHGRGDFNEIVVVANRSDGTVSFLDATFDEVLETVTLPGSAEPMYVVYVYETDKVYVGDRSQSQVHVLNSDTYELETSIDVGQGVFHMWAGGDGQALWVNNDIDNTISIIDLNTNSVIETISLDGKPHDVFVTDDGRKAFVSILRPDTADQVYAFNAQNFERTGTKDVGEDPHLFHLSKSDKLFVPCQNTNQLLTLDGTDLGTIEDTPLDGAHGVYGSLDQKLVVVTGINVSQLYNVKAASSRLIGMPASTSLPIPHNVIINARRTKVFVTHSGASANQVSVFKIARNGRLSEREIITTGLNPFGLTYFVKRE